MTLNEILTAWEAGAKITYQNGRYTREIGEYRPERVDVVKALFYRQGIKFRILK